MTQRQQLFYNYLAQTSDFPLALDIKKAEGIYLYDQQDRPYIDFISGIGVSNVGHRHPKVLEAIQNQLDKYLHLMVYGEYIETPQIQLAKALAELTPTQPPPVRGGVYKRNYPPSLKESDSTLRGLGGEVNEESDSITKQVGKGSEDEVNVYFTNSGAEAVEGAMKLAKRFTGRTEIISCFNAYHGSTQGALSLAGAEFFKTNFRPLLPDIQHIRHGKIEELEKITTKTAAVVIELIGAEAGVRVAEVSYHQALRQRCTDVGALLIYDEIQTGFGRTGSFWAYQQYDTYPDILLTAKGMGGGMPIGAFIAPQHIMSVFKNNPILGHITTFGGHPVSCAASLATLQIIQSENLATQALEKEQQIRSLLRHPKIKEIRGRGLLLAVEFESFEVLKPIIDSAIGKAKQNCGVITDWFLFCNDSMRIAPPLTITATQIQTACEVILEAIDEKI